MLKAVDVVFVMLPNPQLRTPTMYYGLGIFYLAAVLRKKGVSVGVVDMRGSEQVDLDMIPLTKWICISATTGEIGFAKYLAQNIKNGTKTVLGGAHATLIPEDCTNLFDHIVVGEGEDVIFPLIDGKEAMQPIIEADRIQDLDNLPFPAWNLLPENHMFSLTLMPGERYGSLKPAATIIGSRGCPFKCAFCANMLKLPVVKRSPSSIALEMKTLKEYYGVHNFRLEDDNITVSKEWLKYLCMEVKDVNVKWKCHSRANLIDLEMCEWMKDAGCVEVGMGLESADPFVLNRVSKDITVEDAAIAVNYIQKAGMRAKVYLMSGLPGETEMTIRRNITFMQTVKPDKWTLSRFTPYPGCAIWNEPDKFDIKILSRDFSHYWNFPDTSIHELRNATRQTLDRRFHKLYDWLEEHI